MFSSIEELRSQLGAKPSLSADPVYAAKMLHPFPDGPIVDREAFILERVKGKRVLEFGASGQLHEKIKAAASDYRGIDRVERDRVMSYDLDDTVYDSLPFDTFPSEVIVCGEVLEHLTNPGWFLQRLHRVQSGAVVIITVPNALSSVLQKHAKHGLENVNIDHVAWYSPRTLRTLVERYGYTIKEFAYYNGDGPSAEGLIVVCE